MLKSKTIDRLCCLALAAMLFITAVVWAGKASADRQSMVAVGYEGLFDQDMVHTIDIEMDDWDSFIADATQEVYTDCSVTIDGERISHVGIRGKGNTSLSSVASMGSQKYSFKIEFDRYVEGRTYRGLDKLSLNNLIYDATMMKDYLAYTLMAREGVPTPLCSYAQITVNGEPWGLYLAVEGVEDGFMERNNMTVGELYKPDHMSFGGGRGNGQDFDFEKFRVQEGADTAEPAEHAEPAMTGSAMDQYQKEGDSFGGSSGMSAPNDFGSSDGAPAQPPQGMSPPEGFAMPQGMTPPEGLPTTAPEAEENEGAGASVQPPNFGGMLDFGKGNSDVKLQYIDDNPDSYANIFDNAKTNINKNDKKRLVEALKTLSGENARNAVFTDEVIHYLVVHDFLQNDDSYTGMMVHNYYLYEEKGKLAIIPWDYNLAFGGMGAGGSATATINSPIDSPISSGSSSDRPLVGWIFSDDEALEDYHESYGQFIADTIENGWLEREIGRVSAMIRPYVEADKNSFYSAEEFDSAIDALQSYCALRGESIRGQLNGTIPSTSEGQRADSSALIDASGLSISAMGAMHMGGGPSNSFEIPGGDRPGNPPDSFGDPSGIPNTSDMPGQGYFPTMPDVSETRDDSFDGSAGFSTQQAETIMPEMTEHPENEEKLKTENVESSEMDEGTSTRLRENSRSGFVAPSGGTLLDARQVAGSSMSWVEL